MHDARPRPLPAGGGDPAALPRAVGTVAVLYGPELQTARALGEHLLALAERVDAPMRRGDGCSGRSRAPRVGRAREGRRRSGARDAIGTGEVFRSGHDDLPATGGPHGESQRVSFHRSGVSDALARSAQQPPPQAPHMTFFVTSAGSARGAIWVAWRARIRSARPWPQPLGRAARPGTRISAPRPRGPRRPSMHGSGSARAPGRTSRGRSWRRASTTCTARPPSWVSRHP